MLSTLLFTWIHQFLCKEGNKKVKVFGRGGNQGLFLLLFFTVRDNKRTMLGEAPQLL